jgi:catechol 2,3-dioxygenase-like lactoylglutathione lyase family enzyme
VINGAHAIIYSSDAEADRAFLRDVLGLPYVDAGQGWLIFALPPSEVAIHPAQDTKQDGQQHGQQHGQPENVHEVYLMCSDVEALCESLALGNVSCTPIQDEGWGLVTRVTLPGGGELPIYQPRHPRPDWAASAPARKPARAGKPARPVRSSSKASSKRSAATKTKLKTKPSPVKTTQRAKKSAGAPKKAAKAPAKAKKRARR